MTIIVIKIYRYSGEDLQAQLHSVQAEGHVCSCTSSADPQKQKKKIDGTP